jgi:hypothetical protein
MPDERFTAAEVDSRPWHQKTPYAGVKNDPNEIWIVHGKPRQGVNITFTAEAWEEFHQGRRCGECHEPQVKKPWPKTCGICHNDFRLMYDRLMRRYQGEEWVGTTINWRSEMDRLDDELERDNWAEHPTLGIVVPR